jgi:hypothetical protein
MAKNKAKNKLVEITTIHVQTFKEIFGMLEGISSDDVNIILKKEEIKEDIKGGIKEEIKKKAKKYKKKESSSSDSDSDLDSDSDSDLESDSNSDSDSESESDKKSKKKYKKKNKDKNIKKNKDKDIKKNKDKDKDKKNKKMSDSSTNSSSISSASVLTKSSLKVEKKFSQNKGHILVKTMSNNQTTISIVKLDSNTFEKFYLEDDEFSFWTDVKELNKFLKCIDSDGYTIMMYIEKGDEKTIKFKVTHNEKEGKFKSYEQGFTEPDVKIENVPKPDFDFGVVISSQLFRKICSDMKKFSEYIEIKCNEKIILFQCLTKYNRLSIDSYENNDGDVKIQQLNKNNSDKEIKHVKTTFVLEHLMKLKYSANVCDSITLYLKSKSPLFINSNIMSGENIIGKMLVYFSPHDEELTKDDYHDKTKECYGEKKANIKK